MSVEERINEAIKVHQNGRLDEALEIYKSVLQEIPDNQVVLALMSNIAQSYFLLSQILVQMGRLSDTIDCVNKVLSVSPNIPDAQYMMGQLYIRSGNNELAKEHLRYYLRLVPEDTAGAVMLLAHLGDENIPENPPKVYLEHFYSGFASSYDERLLKQLDYKCHQVIFEKMKASNIADADVLDLGCGTGLSGEAIKSLAKHLDGVDLSPAMLAIAQQRNIYASLEAADVYEYLNNKSAAYDVVIAAGLFEHIGKPQQLFKSVLVALRPNGYFIFTTDENTSEDVGINASGFYTHGKIYIENLAKDCGFTVISNENVYMRRENNEPVSGLVLVLQKGE